jgi:hypothetical protein
MQSRVLQRLAVAAVLVLGTGVSVVSTAAARPSRPLTRAARGGFNLFQGSVGLRLHANRVDCNWLTNYGNQCVNPYGSGTIEAGFWPNGSPDNYIFNSGLQIAGTVCYGNGCAGTGPWAGDTVGTFFMDARGDQRQGAAVTNIFDGLNADDIAAWPTAAYVNDPTLYNAALLGRRTISQEDSWVRYWDGDASLSTGRKHAMGVLVEQRGLLWNYPSGNEDILYFLFRFINITSTNASDYAGLQAAGYSAGDIADVVAIANDFHSRAQAAYGVNLPAGGFTFHNMFAAFYQDADEGNASYNYSQAVLPFSLVSVMKSDFHEPLWQYPANIFSDPFYPAPGFEAAKYLKSPLNPATADPQHPLGKREFGISMWSNTCNGCGLMNDPVGVSQMYRFLSGHVTPALGDGVCNSDPIKLHTCASLQSYADTRFFESSGPFDLQPGQSSVIVVALIFAAPVHKWAQTTNGIYAMPAGQIETYLPVSSTQLNTYLPGFPAQPETLALAGTGTGTRVCTTNCTSAATIREPVERAMGWGQFSDLNNDSIIEQTEVQVVPRSLLSKALTAQAIFDNKFLLPFAPEAPPFYLVPGDGNVTVVWQKSATENTTCSLPPCGDPYYQVAKSPFEADLVTPNALYDHNYRQFDVEGYRVWRGRTASEMQVVAQFDYAGTVMYDGTGELYDPNVYGNQCAPELGVFNSCPTGPGGVAMKADGSGYNYPFPLAGNVIQIPPGGRVQLTNGNILIINADTAIVGGGSGLPALVDNGVPFAYKDQNLVDGVQYFYAVTAFDINSLKSGPSSLESSRTAVSVTPRANSGQEVGGTLGATQLIGGDGSTLSGALPTLDKTTGEFSGPMPPTNGIGLGFVAFVPQILGNGSMLVRVDSIVPADGWDNLAGGAYWFTAPGTGAVFKVPIAVQLDNTTASGAGAFPAVHGLQAKSTRYGGDSTYSAYGNVTLNSPGAWELTNWGRGSANSAPAGNANHQGPRWWVGAANENTVDPNSGACSPGVGTCGTSTAVPNRALTAGSLGAGVQVMLIEAYTTVPSVPLRQLHAVTAYLARAADFKVYWGNTAGKPDSVVDVVHKVKVPFNKFLRASWGILNDSSFTRVNAANTPDKTNAVLRWDDIFCIPPVNQMSSLGGSTWSAAQSCNAPPDSLAAFLMDHARLSQVAFTSTAFAAAASAATGTGFIFYIAGQFFMMQMAALPAAGTVWNLRTYSGDITGTSGSYAWVDATRPPAVPGLQVSVQYSGSTTTTTTSDSAFAAIHTVPDPYYVTNPLETSANNKVLQFVNLPSQCIIRIYSVSGILIRVLTHNDPTNGGLVQWDLRNRNNQFVASGVYFYHVEAADGRTKVGRFTVVNYAQ